MKRRRAIIGLAAGLIAACSVTSMPSGTRELEPPPAFAAGTTRVQVASTRIYATRDDAIIVDGWVANPDAGREALHVRVEVRIRLDGREVARDHDVIARIAERAHAPFRIRFVRPDLAARVDDLAVDAEISLATKR